ncbi:MAG: hypothetical protein H0W50_07840 [Parachlamydiaceae bacterium]|nr:hypothetical protein [Parachlamydiaceae bacterium]
MLGFFRKYQRYFFLFITVVIVISFSFFGTSNTLPTEKNRVLPAFRAVDGSYVTRAELNNMVQFLSTDINDGALLSNRGWPNFLNDGAIKTDLLQGGVAEILATQFASDLAPDYQARQELEKRYSLYTHPQAKFVSTEQAWSYYAPSMLTNFQTLQRSEKPLDPAAFSARIRLYLGEKNFPAHSLAQVLQNQERQYSWLTPDQALSQTDLSLFGYHTIEDWFGPRFMRIAAEFYINSAKIAEQRGYRVSKSEVLASLVHNANLSFQQHHRNLGVASSQEYFNEQLRRMGMDQNLAIKAWQNVLLTRRLFQDAGNSAFTSPILFTNFVQHGKESVNGELYQLPKELKLGDYRALQKFELYLNSVAARTPEDKANLTLPKKFIAPSSVAQKHPELVQKRYLLDITKVFKEALSSKVSVKETWNWEVDEANWAKLIKEFPELGTKNANSNNERFAAIDSLNEKTRAKVDSFARSQILETHPEWIVTALEKGTSTRTTVKLPLSGTAGDSLVGVKDTKGLITLLDEASINGQEDTNQEQANADQKLAHFSPDQLNYYKIRVVERLANEEILTFAEANRQGILDKLLDSELQAHYLQIREEQAFLKSDKSSKEFADVKDIVADSYFSELLKAIQAKEGHGKILTGTLAAPLRLKAHVTALKNKVQTSPSGALDDIKTKDAESSKDVLIAAKPLIDQWKLEKEFFKIDRSNKNSLVDSSEAFALDTKGWSSITQSPNGAISFYQKLENKDEGDTALVSKKEQQAHEILSNEIQRTLATQLIAQYKDQQAISVDYLNYGTEMSTDE